jgi:hypothetical protein
MSQDIFAEHVSGDHRYSDASRLSQITGQVTIDLDSDHSASRGG